LFIQEGELTEEEIKGKDSEDIFEVVWTKIEKGYEIIIFIVNIVVNRSL
jgi:preprotein translocase subunit SecA